MNTKILIVLVVIVIALLGVVYFSSEKGDDQNSMENSNQSPANGTAIDTTSAINADIENIDLGDVDTEFQEIDQDLNSL